MISFGWVFVMSLLVNEFVCVLNVQYSSAYLGISLSFSHKNRIKLGNNKVLTGDLFSLIYIMNYI